MEKSIHLFNHTFYLPLSLEEYSIGFGNIIFPVEFTGNLEFYKMGNNPTYIKATTVGFFDLVPAAGFDCYQHRSLVREVGMDEIRRVFIRVIWGDYFLRQQLDLLYLKAMKEKENNYTLVEEF